MIIKKIHALPAREKTKLLKRLDHERELAEERDDIRLFDEASRDVAGQKPTPLRQFLKQAKIKA